MDQELKDVPMICEVLQQLSDENLLSPRQLGDLLNLSPSSAYRYLTETELRAGQLRTVFRGSRKPAVQEAILNWLTEGTGWVTEFLETELDANGDGLINTSDIIDGTIKALQEATESLVVARAEERSGMRRISPEAAQAIDRDLCHAIKHLLAGRRTVALVSGQKLPSLRRTA